ncbi:hypothetical protein FKX85_15995 [Echinicola soli]|uniref:Fibrobacter succinogenes major paralogous domain-containing protein n=1 Tax=Echinicola soli TaxID=2591634 RepID=A0A514CKY7_9BACT|nr:fibrobacter succinogenes major paralogous domain-containing protein [Echinicola soli]QDH80460.1 hypothetical protein FKX85_15995 [Echinicola soli]
MNKPSYYNLLFLCLLAFACVQENIEEPKMGTVSISRMTFEHFGSMSPNSRVAEESEWKHIFSESATLLITNKATGLEYTLEYDPNNFTEAYQIQLPFGEYTLFSAVEGGDFETFLPFTISGEFTLDETSLDISLQGSTEYGLVTVKKEFVQSANLDGEHELVICDHGKILYGYVKEGLSPTLTIYENFNGQPLQKELDISAYNHYHFYLNLTESQGTVNFIELAIGPFEYHEETWMRGEEISYVTDSEGKIYKVVKIGDQYWMAEDLNTTRFCNGDKIPTEGNIFSETPDIDIPSSSNSLISSEYNYYAVMDSRNICPCDWHVPSDEDWIELEKYLGMPIEEAYNWGPRGNIQNISVKLMTRSIDWEYVGFGGSDEYGLNITPNTYSRGYQAYWTSTYSHEEDYQGTVLPLGIIRYFSPYSRSIDRETEFPHNLSVRCVKD